MTLESRIREKLQSAFSPSLLEVVNESHLHRGHAGDNGTGESHFRVKVVSKSFSGLSRVAAQQMVYRVLEEDIKNGIHALSISVLAE
ncbi:MAG: BolA family transcriptional regulator [Micavibrio aeruginosavorus]|nr:BolA family transcriptional regulator [Micavibrio aeruginosavorus]